VAGPRFFTAAVLAIGNWEQYYLSLSNYLLPALRRAMLQAHASAETLGWRKFEDCDTRNTMNMPAPSAQGMMPKGRASGCENH